MEDTEAAAPAEEQVQETATEEIAKIRVTDDDGEHELTATEVKELRRLQRDFTKKQAELEKMKKDSYQRFQKGAELAKSTQRLIEEVKRGNGQAILSHPELGPVVRQAMIQQLANEHDMEQLTPEQRELWELKKEKAERDRAQKLQEQEEAAAERRQKLDLQKQAAHTKLVGILERGGVPPTPELALRMARELKNAYEAEYEVTEEELVEQTIGGLADEFRGVATKMKGEQLLQFLGEDVRKVIRKAELEAFGKTGKAAAPKKAEQGKRDDESYEEWVTRMGGRYSRW